MMMMTIDAFSDAFSDDHNEYVHDNDDDEEDYSTCALTDAICCTFQ